jgi:predicted MFS family arabinose efflux permease
MLKLGIPQIIGWGSGFYLPAILAIPISKELGISTETFFWAFTFSLLVNGLVGPRVGKTIDRVGGRRVMPIGNLVFALGLTTLALSTNTVMLFLAWGIIGLGASVGNYDAAFATAVRFFGQKANPVLAGITLFSGFSSTISWPLTTYLEANFDWRFAVWFWVLAHLLIALPIHLSIPKVEVKEPDVVTGPIKKIIKNRFRFDALILVFALIFALEGFIVTGIHTTLPLLTQSLGATPQVVLIAGLILGPAQVLSRILLMAFGKYITPLQIAAVSVVAHPLGVVLLFIFGTDAILWFVILQGVGVGLNPYVRGSLPLLFMGEQGYGQRQGYVMMPAKFVSAISPTIVGALLLLSGELAVFVSMSIGVAATILLVVLARIHRARQTT